MSILELLANPAAWAALFTLIVMEVVLGIDNLVFVAILSNKLPEHQRARTRRIGLLLALGMRIVLLFSIAWIVGMNDTVLNLGLEAKDKFGHQLYETQFSVRDLILIAGGLFLLYKATKEIHHSVDPGESDSALDKTNSQKSLGFASAIAQIIALDLVFSVDSILTAVGMTDELPIMIAAVITAVGVMMLAATPLSNFIAKNPTVVMLALGFLLMIGFILIADGFGIHIPKGYVYTAIGFSAAVEALNIWSRRAREKRAGHAAHVDEE